MCRHDPTSVFSCAIIQVIGSVVTVNGDMRFIGNDARRDRGGAMYISSFGQILMRVNSSILFENNTGRYVCFSLCVCACMRACVRVCMRINFLFYLQWTVYTCVHVFLPLD